MKRLGLIMISALMAMSCSADADDSSADTVAEETTTTETVEATTTTEETTTTTTEPEADLEAEVEAAYLRSYEVWTGCYLDLPNCDVETEFAKVYTDGTLETLTEATLQSQADGLDYEPPEDPDHARTEIFEIAVAPSGEDASVSFCTYAGEKEFLVGEDGALTPVGLHDTVFVEWGVANLTPADDGVWRIYDYSEGGDRETVLITDLDRLRSEGKICGES